MKQEAELIGLEAMTAEPVGHEIQLQFLDPVFHLAPQNIDFVIDGSGAAAEIGNDKTLVESPWQPFHLGHDPAGSLPRVGLITEGGKRALLAACALEGPLSWAVRLSTFFLSRLLVIMPITYEMPCFSRKR